LEYALLIITVAAAFIAMYRYLSGATGAKLHDIENELNPGVEIQP
jgi:Flp pilus assembly pilin Flp